MATKSVLLKAIEKLEDANRQLYDKLYKASDDKTKERINEEIKKNDSMILDYKFRIDYE